MTRLARTASGRAVLGDEAGFVPLSAACPGIETMREALPLAASGELSATGATASRIQPTHLEFNSPLARPGKLWGIGLNYEEHAADLSENRPDEPASFMQPASSVVGPGGPIRLPPRSQTERVTAEAELGVVIGRTARDVSEERADSVIAGFVPVLDVTAEDILERNPRFLTRAKSFDTFLVLGPWIETGEIGLSDLDVRTVVNDEVVAENVVSNMRFSPSELVAFHSSVMTLEPGDLISTGTPGATTIDGGDTVRSEIDEIGTLESDVVGPSRESDARP
ncbi:MAG: fumarylacetoacetate hydrolase family protein [Halodesulfurarchaeum sp.]